MLSPLLPETIILSQPKKCSRLAFFSQCSFLQGSVSTTRFLCLISSKRTRTQHGTAPHRRGFAALVCSHIGHGSVPKRSTQRARGPLKQEAVANPRQQSYSYLQAPRTDVASTPTPPKRVYKVVPSQNISGKQNEITTRLQEPTSAEQGSKLSSEAQRVQTKESVVGTVQRVKYHNPNTDFTIIRIRQLVKTETSAPVDTDAPLADVTGIFPDVEKGQQVRFEGRWVTHKTFGLQFQAERHELVKATSAQELIDYLSGGSIPGVGPVTAKRMVECLGPSVLDVLDSEDAVKHLVTCKGIGQKTALKIKAGWDQQRDTRHAMVFLRSNGIPPRIIQQLIKRFGSNTEAEVREDPYGALLAIPGAHFRMAEKLAEAVDANPDIPTRVGCAMLHCLESAATSSGDTYLPWGQLEQRTCELLAATGRGCRDDSLLPAVVEALHLDGSIVAEPGASSVNIPQAPPHVLDKARFLKLLESMPELSADHIYNMLARHPYKQLFDILNSTPIEAEKMLQECRMIGPQHAKKIKSAWDRQTAGLKLSLSDGASTPWIEQPDTRCYLPSMHSGEVTVANVITQLMESGRQSVDGGMQRVDNYINRISNKAGLHEGQQAAIREAATAPLMVLTGGPGCGKTHVLKEIVRMWMKMARQPGDKGSATKHVVLCAPTGRAAQRLQEAVNSGANRKKVTATTIHRLLGYKPHSQRGESGDNMRGDAEGDALEEAMFSHNRFQKLQGDCFVVDEASMLDLQLAAALMEALPTGCQFLLVGDADQLPPVGPGGVLGEVIRSAAVPVVDLRHVFRQAEASNIVRAAHDINAGKVPQLEHVTPQLRRVEGSGQDLPRTDALVVQLPNGSSPSALRDAVVTTVLHLRSQLGIDIKNNLQVLSPMRQGESGVLSLNKQLQRLLNPGDGSKAEMPSHHKKHALVYRVGDRVIQSKNDYDNEVYNGDVGYVKKLDCDSRRMTIEFPALEDGGDPRTIEYAGAKLDSIDPAWATTVHKAQGGEADVVVLVLGQHRKLITRKLLYTAVTRARKLLVVVSTEEAISAAVKTAGDDGRLCWLAPRLTNATSLPQQHRLVFP